MSMRADRTSLPWDEGSVTCILSNLPRIGQISDEVAVIHIAGRTYARDGAKAFGEARAMMAPSCVGTEEASTALVEFEV